MVYPFISPTTTTIVAIVLSPIDGCVDCLNLLTLELTEIVGLEKIKSVALMTIERKTSHHRFAFQVRKRKKRIVAFYLCLSFFSFTFSFNNKVKKKMLLYEFVESKSFEFMKELALQEVPICVEWFKDVLFLAYRKKPVEIVEIDSENAIELFPTNTPLLQFLSDDVLVAKDELGM
jgi:hypothetical protein